MAVVGMAGLRARKLLALDRLSVSEQIMCFPLMVTGLPATQRTFPLGIQLQLAIFGVRGPSPAMTATYAMPSGG